MFFTDGVNLGTYCENLRTYCVTFCTNVEIKVCKAKAFHWLIQFQTISALMLRISKCRGLRIFFDVISYASETAVP